MSQYGSRIRGGVTVSFGERYAASDQFDDIFRAGMSLVERSAAYLDGQGRIESKSFDNTTRLVYSTESMRLTTRLLDLASWLLLRRSVRDGEVSDEEARKKRGRINLRAIGRPSHVKGFSDLPETLRTLVIESFALHDRIVRIDRALENDGANDVEQMKPANAVHGAVAKLEQAFTR